MVTRNYSKELDRKLLEIRNSGKTPTLLLHSCCAPCSSYVLMYLSEFFDIIVFYYNPNIFPETEYEQRKTEQKRLLNEMRLKNKVSFLDCDYTPEDFFEIIKGYEKEPEGGKRCEICYKLRLEKTAKIGKKIGANFFASTLSVSPYKNAQKLNEIGETLAIQYNVPYLASDFKKKNGYKISIELSKKYDLYRQNFCGCVFSKKLANKEDFSEGSI